MRRRWNLNKEPYTMDLVDKNIFVEKRTIIGVLVAKAHLFLDHRGLSLIPQRTRAVLTDQIHELVLTDDHNAAPSQTVDHVSILGFMEVKTGGIIAVGDSVSVAENVIGFVAGFDETHMPNHMNIVIAARKLTGHKLELGAEITIYK
jgi:hypothetical protein